jgi:hypothetical protein
MPPPPAPQTIYLVVIDDRDEWSGLVGVLRDYLDKDLEQISEEDKAVFCEVYFPTSRTSLERYDLVGVNDYPNTVISELVSSSNTKVFERERLETVEDPQELL